jgi:translocation and assembly module TamB
MLGSLLFAGIVVLALVTTPWWWPHAARRLLAREGVTFDRFETLGYSRVVLQDVQFQSSAVTVFAERVEADTPFVWLVRGLFSKPGVVEIKTWRAEFSPNTARAITDDTSVTDSATSLGGWPALQARLGETLATLQQWLPQAHATDGTVRYKKQTLTLASLHWLALDGQLTADGLAAKNQKGRATLRWHDSEKRLTLSASTTDEQWSVSFETRDNLVTGDLLLWKQPASLRASFPEHGWLPQEAEFTAVTLAIPGQSVGLGQLYTQLPSEIRVLWQDAHFTVAIRAHGEPAADKAAPPLHLELAGQGDMNNLRIDRFDISLPGTTARLLAPIVLGREAQILSGASQFSLESDLEKIPGAKNLRGKITGRVLVEPGTDGEPRFTARLEAVDVTAPEFHLKQALFEADQNGQILTIKSARLVFADGSNADVKGVWNWRERTLSDAVLEGEIKPAAFARWLPTSLAFSRFSVVAKAEGQWPKLTHSGEWQVVDLTAGTPKPLGAKGKWSGVGPAAESFELEAKTGDSIATLQGRLTREEAIIAAAQLILPDAPAFQLSQPARVRWQPSLRIENVDLVGGDAHVSMAWSMSEATRAKIEAARIHSGWLRDFLPSAWPAWQLDAFALEGTWPKGSLEGAAKLSGQVEIAPRKNARIELTASSQRGGLRIDRLLVRDVNGPVLTARGSAPLLITPAAAPFWQLDPEGNWSLTVDTEPESPFWAAQAEASGIKLRAPRLKARIEGSVKKPDARIEVQAAEIAFERVRLPPISQLDARLVLDDGHVALERFSILVSGQTLTASGRANVKPGQWPVLAKNPRGLWAGDAEANLSLPSIDLSAFATFLPDAFAPTGTLDGQLSLRASGEIDGTLKVANISTHPISPFGSFNQITGEILFTGRKAELKSLSALASGQPVRLSGDVRFPSKKPLAFDITLAGKNLPLARQTGLLIRGDLDLNVKTAGDGRTTLGGNVTLHDGLFLRDVRSLVPTRGGNPASRPPYFSVTRAPFRDWQLALEVGGERFIKLRTPLFNGTISGAFDLTGTLHEPIAIGQVTFNEGNILLPFAALRLKSGSVRLTRADPYSPQIALTAESRTLGYDVRMELTGPVTDPALVFSSSPPLSSEQVLLMVMAGETPRTDISYSGGERATRIGRYLGASLLSDFFGDRSSAERLTITSGENVTERGKETYNVEYKLTENWSVVGERDEFDDYNAGFKRRLFASKKPESTDATKP